MKALERYGAAIIDYEGVGEITFPEESGKVVRGYFEAKQLKAGGIAVGFQPFLDDEDYISGATTLNFYRPRFDGRDRDNWQLTSCGQTSEVPNIGFWGAPKNGAEPVVIFGASRLKARRKGASDDGYRKVQFRLSNLIWPFGHSDHSRFTFEINGLKVTVTPASDYSDIAGSVRAIRGIAPTAGILIESPGDLRLSLEEYVDFIDTLVSALRLTSGNRIDWYFGEAFDLTSTRVVERIHKDAVTGPYSKTIGFTSTFPYVEGLIKALFSKDRKLIDHKSLKRMIDYFVNCCDETSYLEARGVLASTLADLVVLEYAKVKQCEQIMVQEEFTKHVLPLLKTAIDSAQWPEGCDELRKNAAEVLNGAYRRSFRKRLKLLVKECNLSLDSKARHRAVNIRNELVHEGKFLSENKSDWYSEYSFMIWLDFVALCRLAGYDGELPSSIRG